MDRPLETEDCNSDHPEEVNLITCRLLETEKPPSPIPSGLPRIEPTEAEAPLWPYSTPGGIVKTLWSSWHTQCDEPSHGNQDRLSVPTGTERTDSPLPPVEFAIVNTMFSKSSFELTICGFTNGSLDEQIQSMNEETSHLRQQNQGLYAHIQNLELQNQEISHLRQQNQGLSEHIQNLEFHNREIKVSLQAARTQAQKLPNCPEPRNHEHTGKKIPDSEFKSKWRQLKFNVKMLSRHILDHNPELTLQPRHFTTVMKTFRNSKGSEVHGSSLFKGLDTRRLGLEAYLWNFLFDVVFDSNSETDAARTRTTFKRHRKDYAKLKIEDSSQIAAVYDWLQSGWPITKPITPDSVNELLRKDCEEIYQMIHGNDGRKRSDSRAESREEIRDILSLALELDEMIMTSRAMITVVWPGEVPEINAGNCTEYQEWYMEAIQEEREPGENVRLKLCVTPILLKKGNARGTNYESQIVLVKGDVVVAYGSRQGSTEPVQAQGGTAE